MQPLQIHDLRRCSKKASERMDANETDGLQAELPGPEVPLGAGELALLPPIGLVSVGAAVDVVKVAELESPVGAAKTTSVRVSV